MYIYYFLFNKGAQQSSFCQARSLILNGRFAHHSQPLGHVAHLSGSVHLGNPCCAFGQGCKALGNAPIASLKGSEERVQSAFLPLVKRNTAKGGR